MAAVVEATSTGSGAGGSATFTITEPTGTTSGDLLLVVVHQDFAGEAGLTTNVDWTRLGGIDMADASLYPAMAAFWVARGASAPNLTGFNKSSSSGFAWTCWRISNYDTTPTIQFSTARLLEQAPTVYTSPATPAAVNAGAAGFVAYADGRSSGTITPPAGMTESYDVVPDSFSVFESAYETGLTAGVWSPGDATPSVTGTTRVVLLTISVDAAATSAVAVAGSVAGLGSAGGALTNWMPVDGSVDGLGHVSGSLLRTMLLAGAVTGQGAVAGAVDAYHPLDGAVAGLGAVAGAVDVYHPLDGGVAGVGAVAGTVDVFHPLDGGVAGQGAVAGIILRTMLLTGAVKGTGAVSGTLTSTSDPPVRRDIGRPPRHDHSPPPMWRRPTGVSR